jgi:hypothetical protein
MSNELITMINAGLPAHLRELAGDNAGFVTVVESVPKLSIRGGKFRLKVGDKENVNSGPLDVIILACWPETSINAKAYYKSTFIEGSEASPDCKSCNGIAPDKDSPYPQHPTCVGCPQNAWGSKSAGSDAKACSDHKIIYVTLPGRIDSKLLMISLPITSVKNLSAYATELSAHKLPVSALVTELSFEDSTTHPQLNFKAKRFLEVDEVPLVIAAKESSKLLEAIKFNSSNASTGIVVEEKKPMAATPTSTTSTTPSSSTPVSDVSSKTTQAPQKSVEAASTSTDDGEWIEGWDTPESKPAVKAEPEPKKAAKGRPKKQAEESLFDDADTPPAKTSTGDDELDGLLDDFLG